MIQTCKCWKNAQAICHVPAHKSSAIHVWWGLEKSLSAVDVYNQREGYNKPNWCRVQQPGLRWSADAPFPEQATAKLLMMSLKNICMFIGIIVNLCHRSRSHKYLVTHCLSAAYHVLVAHQGSPDIKCQCVEIWKCAWANIPANKKSTAFLLWTWLGKGKVLKWMAKWGNRMKW